VRALLTSRRFAEGKDMGPRAHPAATAFGGVRRTEAPQAGSWCGGVGGKAIASIGRRRLIGVVPRHIQNADANRSRTVT
jgi:hypothetical protein